MSNNSLFKYNTHLPAEVSGGRFWGSPIGEVLCTGSRGEFRGLAPLERRRLQRLARRNLVNPLAVFVDKETALGEFRKKRLRRHDKLGSKHAFFGYFTFQNNLRRDRNRKSRINIARRFLPSG